MISLTSNPITLDRDKILFCALIILICIGGAFAFPLSYLTNSNELIGLFLIPLVATIQTTKRFNTIFLCLFILFGIGAWLYHVRMFYFFSLAFFSLWLAELLLGRLNILLVFLVLFMSPVFYQVTVILGFPIRLQLAHLASTLLEWGGTNVQISGNTMLMNGNEFAVDEACMGLNMLAISMLMAIFIIGQRCRATVMSLKFSHLVTFFLINFVLNIFANLIRILILVFFKIPAENTMHEIVGIACLILYVILPVYFISKFLVGRYGRLQSDFSSNRAPAIYFQGKFVLFLIAISLMMLGWDLNQKRSQSMPAHFTCNIPGFKTEELDHEVTKIVNGDVLIYIKPIQEFFSGEHTPLICWRGSGYKFKNIRVAKVGANEIYFGQLARDNDRLYTAWWYDNGSTKTISQLDWRMRMAKGEGQFNLINVTAANPHKLMNNIKTVLQNDFFRIDSKSK